MKIFFQINVEWNSKKSERMAAAVKTGIKQQEIKKKLVAVIL